MYFSLGIVQNFSEKNKKVKKISSNFSKITILSCNSYVRAWTSLYMDGTAINFFKLICPHEAGTWHPNYTPGVDFFDHDFLKSKKFKSRSI